MTRVRSASAFRWRSWNQRNRGNSKKVSATTPAISPTEIVVSGTTDEALTAPLANQKRTTTGVDEPSVTFATWVWPTAVIETV